MPEHRPVRKAQPREEVNKSLPLSGKTFDLMTLTQKEEIILQAVLQKEELEMRILDIKISEVRKEIQDIRKAGALTDGDDQDSICARCKFKFPRFYLPWVDHGERCSNCKFRVCTKCCMKQSNGSQLCILCFKNRQEKLLTGEWMTKGQSIGINGSEFLKTLLRDKRRVPKESDEPSIGSYTQRPARSKEVDNESRTSRNSQSSIEKTDCKDQGSIASLAENNPDEKRATTKGEDDKGELINRHRRESYTQAVETEKSGVISSKVKKSKPHWWQKGSKSRSRRDDVEPIGRSSDLDSEVSSLGSCSSDKNTRRDNYDTFEHNNMDTRNVNNNKQLVRKGKNTPAVLPSRFQFRRSSSLSQSELQGKDFRDAFFQPIDAPRTAESKSIKNILKFPSKKSNLSKSDTHLHVDEEEDETKVRKPKSPKVKNLFKNAHLSRENHHNKIHSDEDDSNQETTSKNKDRTKVHKSKVNRMVDFITKGSASTAKESSGTSETQNTTEKSESNEKESMKDTDSGITSGHTSRTTTPEQRGHSLGSPSNQTSVPVISVTSAGSQSFLEEDDDLEELFSNRLPNQLLGSRSSLADSRESIYSVYSDAGEVNYGRIPVTGEIMFHVAYNHKTSTLEVHVKQCRDLAPVDTKHDRSDPYVKTYLLPDKSRGSKRKTRIKKHTLNPVFDEVLKYQVSSADLESRSLWLTVWHNDRLGRNDFLGEVTIPLDYYRFDQSTPMWYPLMERAVTQDPVMFYKGDLSIALKYVPADMVEVAPKKKPSSFRRSGREKEKAESVLGEVHVLVREAQNLTAMRGSAGSNPFCKGYLLPDVSHSSKQKTPVIKKTTNPQWQHILIFEGVDKSQLHEYGLELTVWDYEKLSSNDFLGGVRLNLGQGIHNGKPADWMDARGEEIEAWHSMIDHPNEWIDSELPLRASMGKQNSRN